VVHEYAHLVSVQVNLTTPNNPRWLWEAIATYEAGRLSHPGSWPPGTLTFPGFPALNQFNSSLPFRWGFLIPEAVVERWGMKGIWLLSKQTDRYRRRWGFRSSNSASTWSCLFGGTPRKLFDGCGIGLSTRQVNAAAMT